MPGDTIVWEGMCSPGDQVQYGWGPTDDFSLNLEAVADETGFWTGQATIPLDAVPGDGYEVGQECGGLLGKFQPFAIVAAPAQNIVLLKTVGTDPATCATEREIIVPSGTTVYHCYTVTNNTDVVLDTHTLVDDKLGTLFSDLAYDLAPGASVDTVVASAVIEAPTINGATWTASASPVGAAPVVFEADAGAVVTVSADTTMAPVAEGVAASPNVTGWPRRALPPQPCRVVPGPRGAPAADRCARAAVKSGATWTTRNSGSGRRGSSPATPR